MRVRHAIAVPKYQQHDTGWRDDDMPPRACPIFPKGRPVRAGWEWRSAKAVAGLHEFVLVALVNVRRGDWKAMLISNTESGYSLIARYEYHASHPGQHVHSDCARSGIEVGATGMSGLTRVPSLKSRHRRTATFTPSTFWRSARKIFRIHDDLGPLYRSLHGRA